MADDPNGEAPSSGGRKFPGWNGEPAEHQKDEPHFNDMIGLRLKQYYSERLSQPLPDKFAQLLRELAEKEAN